MCDTLLHKNLYVEDFGIGLLLTIVTALDAQRGKYELNR